MRFSRAATSVKALESKQTLTLNDALNVFLDLCEDIKDDQDVTADRLPAGDGDEAVSRLSWMSRTILRMAGQLPVEEIDQERMQRLQKVENSLEQTGKELESVNSRLKTLRERKAALQKTESQLEEALREDKELKEECGRLAASIQEYQELKIPGLQVRRERLLQEKQSLQAEYDGLLHKCSMQEQDNKDSQAEIAEKNSQFEKLLEAFRQLEEEKKNLEEETGKLEERYQELKKQLQNTDSSRRSLVEQIENLEQSLSRTDIESLRQLYEQRLKELRSREQEQKDLEEQIRQKEEELNRLKENLAEKKKRAEKMAWEAEDEEKKAGTALELLESRMKEAEARKQELMSQAVRKEKEAAALEEWFQSLEAAAYAERLKNSQERLKMLKTARDYLEADLNRLQGLTRREEADSLNQYRQYFRDAMEAIEKNLDQYQKSYCIVSNIFENGGNGL